jgi:uncharacterized phage protein gp47/JayE
MPLRQDRYEQRDAAQILDLLAAELRAEFGADIDLTESSVFRTVASAIANSEADDIETALREVTESAYIDGAEGELLDRLVALLGVSRRDATHATGVVAFSRPNTTNGDYQITNGSIVKTSGSQNIEFETTELVTLSLFDDFESGSLDNVYAGDRTSFAVVDGSDADDPSPTQETYMLRGNAVDGDQIIDDAKSVSRGSVMDFRTYMPTGTEAASLFGVVSDSDYYQVRLDESAGTHAIEITTPSGTTTLGSNSVSIPAGEWLRVEIQWDGQSSGRIKSKVYDASENLVDELTIVGEAEINAGGFGFKMLTTTDHVYWDWSGERAVWANARAREGGTIGNVAANTLTVMSSPPNGVSSVTNPFSMGDDSYRLNDTTEFSTGRPREDDETLRNRAQQGEGTIAAGTVKALLAELSSLPEAKSVTINQNKTDTDNTGSGGLPPKSFEVVYFGSDPDNTIAETIFETKAFTANDYGGASGTATSATVTADNGQQFTIEWTEPTELAVDITLDIVVNDEFIGADPLRDRIVDYVGGTAADGTSVIGTGVSEDIYVDQIEDVVTGPDDTGVIGIGSKSFTPATTTDANGLEIVDVGANEVATTDATDGSISFTITRV